MSRRISFLSTSYSRTCRNTMATRTISDNAHVPINNDEENPPVSPTNSSTSLHNNDDSDDDDNLTIIGLDTTPDEDEHHAAALAWLEQNGPEMERRRRNILMRELERVQRASFIHFILLCLIPTALLIIVIVTVLSDEEDCGSEMTRCQQEPRTFVNAFTTRCICDAVNVNNGEG